MNRRDLDLPGRRGVALLDIHDEAGDRRSTPDAGLYLLAHYRARMPDLEQTSDRPPQSASERHDDPDDQEQHRLRDDQADYRAGVARFAHAGRELKFCPATIVFQS